jgi:hypothetical protein
MADDFQSPPDSENPFDQIMRGGAGDAPTPVPPLPGGTSTAPPPPSIQSDQQSDQPLGQNPFGVSQPVPTIKGDSSTGGAAIREAVGGIGPAAGALLGGAGGGKIGAGIGALFGPADEATVPIGTLVGGFLGGVGGGFTGAWAANKVQDFAIKKLPDDWQESIASQKQVDEQQHPTASFLGGLAPYVMTMSPFGVGRGALNSLPSTATSLQRIMANPLTQRFFGGLMMGGMELGQEATQGSPDWSHVAIATGIGMIMSKPNALGTKIHALGEAPFNALGEVFNRSPTEIASNLQGEASPTLAQGADAKVMGMGINEEVAAGNEQQSDAAAQIAQQTARDELETLGPPTPPVNDLHALARMMDPDTFDHYDAVSAQRDTFRDWLAEHNAPDPDRVNEAQSAVDELQTKYDQHLAEANGYTDSPEARRLRAQLRDAQSQLDAASTPRSDDAEATQVRQHLQQMDYAMRDLAPQVSSAYRRAAEYADAHMAPPPPPAQEATEAAAPAETQGAPLAALPDGETPPAAAARSTAQQLDYIKNAAAVKLIRAGRPVEQAFNDAAIEAFHYVSRAQRLKGAIGTGDELYDRESGEIRAGRSKVPAAPPIVPTTDVENATPAPVTPEPQTAEFAQGRELNQVSPRQALATNVPMELPADPLSRACRNRIRRGRLRFAPACSICRKALPT